MTNTDVEASELSHLPRRPLSWSDMRLSPLHDFPVRDEVLYQFLDWSPELDVLEIGPGSGFTAFWLSRQVRHITLLDAAAQAIHDLRGQLGHIPNLEFVAADASRPDLAALLNRRYDAVFGLDVFYLVPDSDRAIRNMGQCLRPGGQMLLSFPNMPPPRSKGVTCFHSVEELEAILCAAGFVRWEIFNIRLSSYAHFAYELFHELPLRAFQRIRGGRARRDTIYEGTWAFQHRDSVSRWKPVLDGYWTLLGWIMQRGKRVFVEDAQRDSILDGQLLVRAWR